MKLLSNIIRVDRRFVHGRMEGGEGGREADILASQKLSLQEPGCVVLLGITSVLIMCMQHLFT